MFNVSPTLRRHTGRIEGLSFSPDGRLLASAGEEDMSVRVWDVATGDLLRAFVLGDPGFFKFVRHVAFSPEGDRLYAVAEGDTDRIFAWNWPTHDLIYEERPKRMLCRGLSSGGRLAMLYGYRGDHGHCRLFDLRERGLTSTTFPPDLEPEAIAADGSILMSWHSEDYESYKWTLYRALDGQVIYESTDSGSHGLLSVNGRPMVIRMKVGSDERVTLQFLEEPFTEVRSERPLSGPVDSMDSRRMQFVPATRVLVGCHMHKPAEAFDLDIGETVATIDAGPSYDTVLAASPDGQRVAIGDASGSIRLVRTDDWQVERTIRGLGHNRALAVSSDGRYLAVEKRRRSLESVWLWDLENLRMLGQMERTEENQLSLPSFWRFRTEAGELLYLPDLRWLGYEESHTHQLIERAMRFEVEPGSLWQSYPHSIEQRAVTSNGRWLALIDNSDVVVVDLESHRVAHRMPMGFDTGSRHWIAGIAISPDGRKAALGLSMTDKDVLVYDFARSRVTEKRGCGDTFDSLAFDPKGRYLAIGDAYMNEAYLRPITRGVKKANLRGHYQAISSLGFSPSGDLVSSGDDGQVIIWDGQSLERKATLVTFENPQGWAAFTPDGEFWGSEGVEREFVPIEDYTDSL